MVPRPARADAPPGSPALACVADDRLGLVAARLLLAGAPVSPDDLTALAREAAVQSPALRAVVVGAEDDGRVRAMLERAARTADGAPLRCGEARDAARRAVVVGVAAGALVSVDAGRVEVRLAAGFAEPRVLLRDAEGRPEELDLAADGAVALPEGLRAATPADEGVPHRALLQLVASGPAGPRPVAELALVPADAAPPSRPAPAPSAPDLTPVLAQLPEPEPGTGARPPPDPARDAERVQRLVDALRDEHGVPPVRPNRLLARAAAGHAGAVCAAGRAAHVLAEDGDPQRRLARAGLSARLVGEAVARAADLGAALRALGRSPSHVAALVDRRLTDAGVGVVAAPAGGVCVVVALAAWPRAAPFREAAAADPGLPRPAADAR